VHPTPYGLSRITAHNVLHDRLLLLHAAKGQRFGLRKRKFLIAQRFLRLLTKIVQHEPAPDGRQRKPCLGGKVFKACAFAHQHCEGDGFIERRQVFALHVLDGGKVQLVVLGQLAAHFHRHGKIAADGAALGE
jgi:hypothetical protein